MPSPRRNPAFDQPDYEFYVVLSSGEIESGWSFREDAAEHLKDSASPYTKEMGGKVWARRTLIGRGIDPENDLFWLAGERGRGKGNPSRKSKQDQIDEQDAKVLAEIKRDWKEGRPAREARLVESMASAEEARLAPLVRAAAAGDENALRKLEVEVGYRDAAAMIKAHTKDNPAGGKYDRIRSLLEKHDAAKSDIDKVISMVRGGKDPNNTITDLVFANRLDLKNTPTIGHLQDQLEREIQEAHPERYAPSVRRNPAAPGRHVRFIGPVKVTLDLSGTHTFAAMVELGRLKWPVTVDAEDVPTFVRKARSWGEDDDTIDRLAAAVVDQLIVSGEADDLESAVAPFHDGEGYEVTGGPITNPSTDYKWFVSDGYVIFSGWEFENDAKGDLKKNRDFYSEFAFNNMVKVFSRRTLNDLKVDPDNWTIWLGVKKNSSLAPPSPVRGIRHYIWDPTIDVYMPATRGEAEAFKSRHPDAIVKQQGMGDVYIKAR